MVQKSAAMGMADILPLVAQPGRRVEVRLRDELMAEDLQTHDIIYVGPIALTRAARQPLTTCTPVTASMPATLRSRM